MSSTSGSLVTVTLDSLIRGDDLSVEIEKAFGPHGLGILTVSGVPDLPRFRKALLELTPALANLPEDAKAALEDPESSYSFGWSHGRESLQNGQRDIYKGSFYANPVEDMPCTSSSGEEGDVPEDLMRQYPAYLRPNIWPRENLPQLEPAFKSLGRLVVDVGKLLLSHCDRYVASRNPQASPGGLRAVLEGSRNHKARLLHYFPPTPTSNGIGQLSSEAAEGGVIAYVTAHKEEHAAEDGAAKGGEHERKGGEMSHDMEWCGWHLDHGSLTGLTSAMYLTKEGQEVACPDPSAGLYVRDRSGAVVKAAFPSDHIAFQVGESMQVHSGGLLRATPHYVRASKPSIKSGGIGDVSRSTFAVFLQPSVQDPLNCPAGAGPEEVAVPGWKPSMTFGEFSNARFDLYYNKMG